MSNVNELIANTGIVSSDFAQKSEILRKSGLDWKVRSEKLVTVSGIETENIAVVREDNNTILGVHKDGYVHTQNSEMLDLLFELSEKSGLKLHKGGSFKGGALTYLQLKSEDLILGTDKVVGSITGINSHDGTTALGFGNTNITISCRNTFFMAYKELSHKIKHTKNMQIKIDALLFQIQNVLNEEKTIFAKIKRLSEIQLDQKTKDLVLSAVLNLSKNETLGNKESLSTRKQNILFDLETNIIDQTKDKGQNLWGLFSGITKYTTHGVKGEMAENKMIGSYGKKDQTAFELLTKDMVF